MWAAITAHGSPDPRFFAAAPTRDQAKAIYWADLKAMAPPILIAEVRESDLTIRLKNGAEIVVVGMDRPQRIEGRPWNGGVLDEFANMRPGAWTENVRPALSDRQGWCWFVGVPEGRNHYYELYERARSDPTGEWAAFSWPSSDILPPKEIESARRDLDELTFAQEYEASFVTFAGRAYYPFDTLTHCAPLAYDPGAELVLGFDFNVSPGIAVICQEQTLPNGLTGTAVIGEVWIPRDSNTERVCAKIVQDWGDHRGRVTAFGDATGGAKGSAKLSGTDWEIIKAVLRPVYGPRLSLRVPPVNPAVRSRVNAVNSRLRSVSGEIRLMVDPAKAPKTVRDLEGTRVLDGTAGEIDKRADPMLTHLSDALGYYVAERFPVVSRKPATLQAVGMY